MLATAILHETAKLIEDRAAERDLEQERSMERAVTAYNALQTRCGANLTEADGWLFMVCLKLSRATAGQFRLDDWMDAAAYCALTAECLMAKMQPDYPSAEHLLAKIRPELGPSSSSRYIAGHQECQEC